MRIAPSFHQPYLWCLSLLLFKGFKVGEVERGTSLGGMHLFYCVVPHPYHLQTAYFHIVLQDFSHFLLRQAHKIKLGSKGKNSLVCETVFLFVIFCISASHQISAPCF